MVLAELGVGMAIDPALRMMLAGPGKEMIELAAFVVLAEFGVGMAIGLASGTMFLGLWKKMIGLAAVMVLAAEPGAEMMIDLAASMSLVELGAEVAAGLAVELLRLSGLGVELAVDYHEVETAVDLAAGMRLVDPGSKMEAVAKIEAVASAEVVASAEAVQAEPLVWPAPASAS